MTYKTCTKCKKPFPATKEFFPPHKQYKDGFKGWCRECCNQQRRERYQNNLEQERQRACDYRKKDLERARQRDCKWSKNNPDKISAKNARRRARKLDQTPNLTQDEKLRIDLIYEKKRELGLDWQVDHIIPLSKGGVNHPDNLWIVTKKYNLSKGGKLNFRLPFDYEVVLI